MFGPSLVIASTQFESSRTQRYSRCGSECALLRILPNGGERVRNNRHEEVDEPEVEYNDASDEEETRYEEFRVHHLVHKWGPLHF